MSANWKKIIAHRGAWKEEGFPENSLEAFLKAQELPIGGIEFDLQLTKDHQVVVYHDDEIEEKAINKLLFSEIEELLFSKSLKALSFEKLMTSWKGEKTLWIELKPAFLGESQKEIFVQEVLKILKNRPSGIHFISFDLFILRLLRRKSSYPCSYLGEDFSVEQLPQVGLQGIDAESHRYFQDTSFMEEIKRCKMCANAWTVNRVEEAQKLLQLGIDYLTTDEVGKMLRKL